MRGPKNGCQYFSAGGFEEVQKLGPQKFTFWIRSQLQGAILMIFPSRVVLNYINVNMRVLLHHFNLTKFHS